MPGRLADAIVLEDQSGVQTHKVEAGLLKCFRMGGIKTLKKPNPVALVPIEHQSISKPCGGFLTDLADLLPAVSHRTDYGSLTNERPHSTIETCRNLS